MAEKRKRGQNFSSEEKIKLLKLIIKHKQSILNKKTDNATNKAKFNSWTEVTDSFNSSSTIYRPKESLMKMWEKLKSESKTYFPNINRKSIETGGGPNDNKIDHVLEQVCAILGRGCSGMLEVQDSDEQEESFPKVQCVIKEELDYEYINIDQNEEETRTFTTTEENVLNTPLWSRRQPHISEYPEISKAASNFYASIQDVNKKKECIEDLKLKLLEAEIVFKNKMHNLQLQIATKELEIKTTILEQLKSKGPSPL